MLLRPMPKKLLGFSGEETWVNKLRGFYFRQMSHLLSWFLLSQWIICISVSVFPKKLSFNVDSIRVCKILVSAWPNSKIYRQQNKWAAKSRRSTERGWSQLLLCVSGSGNPRFDCGAGYGIQTRSGGRHKQGWELQGGRILLSAGYHANRNQGNHTQQELQHEPNSFRHNWQPLQLRFLWTDVHLFIVFCVS